MGFSKLKIFDILKINKANKWLTPFEQYYLSLFFFPHDSFFFFFDCLYFDWFPTRLD